MPTLTKAPEIVLGFDVSQDTLTVFQACSSSPSQKPCVIDNTAVAIRRFLKSLKRVDLAICEPTGGHEHVLLVELMAASVITAFLAMVAVGGLVSVTSARNTLDEATVVMDE